jgi:hypothetical protein
MRTFFVCLLIAASHRPTEALTIPLYDTHDLAFTAPVTGNPLDVELTGVFAGPGGVRLSVPGFYDGGGVWKVRFSPVQVGKWSLRTVSA